MIRILSAHEMPGKSVGENVNRLCEQIVRAAQNNETMLAVCIGNLSTEDPAVIDAQEEIENLVSGMLGVAIGSAQFDNRQRAEQTIFRYLLGCFILATSGKMPFEDIYGDLQILCQQMLAAIWDEPYRSPTAEH